MTLKILATANEFPPQVGGIASCLHGYYSELASDPRVAIKVLARGSAEVKSSDDAPWISRVDLPSGNIGASIAFANAIQDELKKKSYDLTLHGIWLPEALPTWALQTLGKAPKIPYYLLAHGVEVMESRSSLKKCIRSIFSPIKRRVFAAAQGVIAVSQFTADLVIQETGISPSRVHVINNGIFPEDFEVRRNPHLARAGFHLLSVCRLDDYKGIDVTLQALALIQDRVPHLVYTIIGVGPDLTRLKNICRQLKLEHCVRFIGRIPKSDLYRFYLDADLFVLMSREDRKQPNVEGFGIVFLEAAASGLPVLAGASGGISDAVQDGHTGWLVDPLDVHAIAKRIVWAAEHPAELERAAEAGRSYATLERNWKHQANLLIQTLEGSLHVRD